MARGDSIEASGLPVARGDPIEASGLPVARGDPTEVSGLPVARGDSIEPYLSSAEERELLLTTGLRRKILSGSSFLA